MTPQQLIALLSLISDLYSEVGMLRAEVANYQIHIEQLESEVTTQSPKDNDGD